MTEWHGVHLPAAQAWIKTEIDLRRYLDERAGDIYVHLSGRNFALNELPDVVRQMFVVRFIEHFRKEGSVPYTQQDAADAVKKAEEFAEKTGGVPIVGVAREEPKE